MCNTSHQKNTHEKKGCCHEHNHENDSAVLFRVCTAFLLFLFALFLHLTGWTKLAVFSLAYLIAGGDILFRALKNIFKGRIFDENFLMSIATLGAFAIKEYPEAVMVMILYQTGEYFQHRAVEKSKKSISDLMDIRPDYANLETNEGFKKISPEKVNINEIIIVKTGEKIPLDGIVTDGGAVVDTSALTGEAVPRTLQKGDEAISGCINTNGFLKIRVTKPFSESTVSKILELVEHASSKKAKTENFITRFAAYYTPAVVIAAVLLAVLPPIITGGAFSVWFERALTFLVISCPCALVISVPLGFFAGIGGASKCGVLIKGSSYLEALANPDTVIFDKTGTLTKGSFVVTQLHPYGTSKDELIEYSALAESYSNHPIALSLKKAYGKDIDSTRVNSIEEIAGHGVKAEVDGKSILCGSARLMEKFNITCEKAEVAGTVVYTAINNVCAGYIVITDELKEDAKEALKNLKKYVKHSVMLTGDTKKSAEYTAGLLGIDKVYAELLPADKVKITEGIIASKSKNKSVIFAGDGINDAPVLTMADVGIAMGALGSDAAIEAADAVIMDDKPSKIVSAIRVAKKTMRIVKQNIVFALGVKALFLALGATGFVTMWGAIFADVGVTVIAILNSLRALRVNKFC